MTTQNRAIGSLYVWDGGSRPESESPSVQPVHIEPDHTPQTHVRPAEKAYIGDALGEVAVWCELGGCIARYTEPGARGHADIRARALTAGWCRDGLGRLICPACQQRFPIWSSAPVVPHRPGAMRLLGSREHYIGRHRARTATNRARRLGGGITAAALAEAQDLR